jgi:serine O-acetyltransferase
VFKTIQREIKNVYRKDPACNSFLEILFYYPGVQAIIAHRFFHWWWTRSAKWGPLKAPVRFFTRFVAYLLRAVTGIEIHPAAQIGAQFFIDHGMGVVIGETAVIGDNVTIYQGVTLGGTSTRKEKRHPTLGSNIVIGAGAKVLGNITIGNYVQIGANSVVVRDVPPYSTVVGIPGRIVKMNGKSIAAIDNLEHNKAPDWVGETIQDLQKRLEELETERKRTTC